jgi:phosphoglycerol transferase MdoB-like AlkP superfamily enzyme
VVREQRVASIYNLPMSERQKLIVSIVSLQLILAVLFITSKTWMSGPLQIYYQSYFADLLIPFSFYFLLILINDKHKYLRRWWARSLSVFALCSLSETLQYFGIYALATIFDPVDYLMYGLGVLLAAFIDRQLFTRAFSFWN